MQDLNLRPSECKSDALPLRQLPIWCPGGDLNSHELPHYHLKVARLPIPPPGLIILIINYFDFLLVFLELLSFPQFELVLWFLE